jgi:ketopantoate hydroxymethyltransferase
MTPRHCKRYGDLGNEIQSMLREYKGDVEVKKFPTQKHYIISPDLSKEHYK